MPSASKASILPMSPLRFSRAVSRCLSDPDSIPMESRSDPDPIPIRTRFSPALAPCSPPPLSLPYLTSHPTDFVRSLAFPSRASFSATPHIFLILPTPLGPSTPARARLSRQAHHTVAPGSPHTRRIDLDDAGSVAADPHGPAGILPEGRLLPQPVDVVGCMDGWIPLRSRTCRLRPHLLCAHLRRHRAGLGRRANHAHESRVGAGYGAVDHPWGCCGSPSGILRLRQDDRVAMRCAAV